MSATAISLTHNCDDSQPIGVPVATKSQPKPKARCSQSCSRQTKRPPSERRFKCDQCERMFFTRKDVKRHLVVHTGIRNFACPYCTQRFGRKDHLVRHAKKSHNRDTRSSTTLRTTSATHTSNQCKTNAMPALIQPKNNISLLGQQISNNSGKHSVFNNYHNSQNGDHSTHSALVLLTNSNNSNNDNHCSNYANDNHTNHSNNINSLCISGMHTNHSNESLYVSGVGVGVGVHSFDDMITPNAIKSETPPLHPLGTHHYFTFPVNTTPLTPTLTYPPLHPSFLPNFVSNSSASVSSCGSTASVAAFGIPVTNASNSIHTNITLDVNPSLPHFNQAFQ